MTPQPSVAIATGSFDLAAHERPRLMRLAALHRDAEPVTITAFPAERSAGGTHDYYSEGDYWWPNPEDPDGPYIRRDGFSNPDYFNKHRVALRRMAIIVPALTAAWRVTGEKALADAAAAHLRAWFVEPATRMNANLQYGQAIKGITTGRGIGLVDTTHLAEVAVATRALGEAGMLDEALYQGTIAWFRAFMTWMRTSQLGIDERDHGNNHTTCWVLQVAAYAELCGDVEVLAECRERFRNVLLRQMDERGAFPLELERTKPLNYTLFNIDLMTATCQILSRTGEPLWHVATEDGRCLAKPAEFLFPYLRDKSTWPYPRDVEYFDEIPVRQPFLLFAGVAYNKAEYIALWKELESDPTVEEIIRNLPIRQPLLWF
ncbi:MAG: hypothetical protein PWP23_1150 [Candidatus Sumerlaeota bacterium]|nr:hypothetical protein [Candidatus Sumerlaeota bacterium]